jgi:hypothetical protein
MAVLAGAAAPVVVVTAAGGMLLTFVIIEALMRTSCDVVVRPYVVRLFVADPCDFIEIVRVRRTTLDGLNYVCMYAIDEQMKQETRQSCRKLNSMAKTKHVIPDVVDERDSRPLRVDRDRVVHSASIKMWHHRVLIFLIWN